MLHHRQQLDVRVAERSNVRDQPIGQLAVCEQAVRLPRRPLPRSEMHFVDRGRAIQPGVALRTAAHPVVVPPHITIDVPDNRRGRRRHLEEEAVRVGLLEHDVGPAREDLVLVADAGGHAGGDPPPDAARPDRFQLPSVPVPAVEVADEPHAARVRRPDGEVRPGLRLRHQVRAELVVDADVGAFIEEMKVVVGDELRAPGPRPLASDLRRHRASTTARATSAKPPSRKPCAQRSSRSGREARWRR